MPRPKWKPADQLTPFARLVRDEYMWKQIPSMTVPQLADKAGISKQAIWGWFQHDSLPRRVTIIQLAQRTGLDVDVLLRAAGMPDTSVDDAQRRTLMRAYRVAMKRLTREIEADASIAPADRATFLAYIARYVKERLDAGAALTDLTADTSADSTASLDEAALQDDSESGARRRRTPVAARR